MALPKSIAVDGPAGSGKSSICYSVAHDLGYLFVDTGAFYRAITLAAINANMVNEDEAQLVPLAQRACLDITPDRDADDRHYTILLDSEDVTKRIRDRAVEDNVSRVSAMRGVRAALNAKYRALASRSQVIMAGRDIGTVVLPDADLKIYLDASLEVRAERRYLQCLSKGEIANRDEIRRALHERDLYDSQRANDPLRRPPDARYINTDHMTLDEVVTEIKRIILAWGADKPARNV